MTSMVEYNKNSMDKVNDILNNKKIAQEGQHCIINIYNVDNNDNLHVECDTFNRMALIYLSIIIVLEEFPDFKVIYGKQVCQGCELLLDSQQIETILLKYEEIMDLSLKNREHFSFKEILLNNTLKLILNPLKALLEDEE